jgi:CheY-like chemotaxis protein
MSQANFTSELISTAHSAQVIHQNGTLIFANTAAAELFGFASIIEFAKFAKTTTLLDTHFKPNSKLGPRILMLPTAHDGVTRTHVVERRITWCGATSTHLALTPLNGDAHGQSGLPPIGKTDDANVSLDPTASAETYFSDTLGTALDWQRTDSEGIETTFRAFDFGRVCVDLCEGLMAYAASCDVKLNIEITPRAQRIFHGDDLKMARAASCIVRHVINRARHGRVDVVTRASENGDYIVFEACGSGRPYRPEDANTLFDIDGPAAANPALDCPPTNMNLPLARSIARFLGGEVSLKINYAKGNMVRMKLPFHQVVQDAGTMRSSGQTHRKLDILVVEDNPTSQHVIKVILDALGHRATIAANGKECLDILLHASFDVIFMDLHMPIKDGYYAIQQIRARERSGVLLYDRAIPILAITADRRPEARTRALAIGTTGFLTKPVHVPQIMAALTPYVQRVADPITGQPNLRMASRGA